MMPTREILTLYIYSGYNDSFCRDYNTIITFDIMMPAVEILTLYTYSRYNYVRNGELNAVYLSWIYWRLLWVL